MKKKVLSLFLALIMMFCLVPITANAESGYKTGDTITLGLYPQKKVTDSKVISALVNRCTDDKWINYNYYSADSGDYKGGNMSVNSNIMSYQDIVYSGTKYRAVKIENYRPFYTGFSAQDCNSFQDENLYTSGETYYFEYEPIKWQVLNPETGLIMCTTAIDSQPYNNYIALYKGEYYNSSEHNKYATDWESSTIRQWLNEDFYKTAFSDDDKTVIQSTHLKTESSTNKKYNSAETDDNIFLLSVDDVTNKDYDFVDSIAISDRLRQFGGTDYAKSQGLLLNNNKCWWYLRTPSTSLDARAVRYDGNLDGPYETYSTCKGIIPACTVDLSAITRLDSASSNGYKVGDIVTFGSYPQSRVDDAELIAALENAGNAIEWTDYGYYKGNENITDGGGMYVSENMMLYKDIKYKGDTYRAVKINDYRPFYTVFSSNGSNSWQDNTGYYTGKTYYFKYEPLKWRVLDPKTGYVVCTTAIDSQPYNNYYIKSSGEYYGDKNCSYFASNWKNSSLRKWLNEDFYKTAFSARDKYLIKTTKLKTESIISDAYAGGDTRDKIFLLSSEDATNPKYSYFASEVRHDENRLIGGTEYAKSQGLYLKNSKCWWYLRDALISNGSRAVRYDGDLSDVYETYSTCNGVVPACKVNLVGLNISSSSGGTVTETTTQPTTADNKADKVDTTANKNKSDKKSKKADTATSSKQTKSPLTGSNDYVLLCLMLVCGGSIVLITVVSKKKKCKKQN